MSPLDVTDRYFDCIRARDLERLMQLYANEASFTLPNGRECLGIEAIRDMHRMVFGAGGPLPTPLKTVIGENSIAVEIEARLPDGTVRRTANFYYLNSAGLIQAVSVYIRTS